jgi:hypothetical protein
MAIIFQSLDVKKERKKVMCRSCGDRNMAVVLGNEDDCFHRFLL